MSLSKKQREFVKMQAVFILWCYDNGYELTDGEAWRPNEMQEIYVSTGRSKAKYSKHQDKLARDWNLFINGSYTIDKELYRPLGEKWEELGGRWGGRFGVKPEDYDTEIGWDSNHFEYRS